MSNPPYDWKQDPDLADLDPSQALAKLVDERERARDISVAMMERLNRAEAVCELLEGWVKGGRSNGEQWARVVLALMVWKVECEP